MNGAPAISVEAMSAGYFGTPVIRDVSIVVNPGEVVALLGPNGAGKTTTLETIAGFNRPMSGSIAMSGRDIVGVATHQLARRGLGFVPEGRALFFGLTVREHLRLARSKDGVGESELFAMLPELKKCVSAKAGQLSGGEQQMLALGRALVVRPRILLVDEMSLGLAPVIVERLLPLLRRAADELGTAVLFVEQHVSLALEVADRACVLAHGRIVLEGRAEALRSDRKLLAASYLGERVTNTSSPEMPPPVKDRP